MPIYEYQCPKCQKVFEEWVHVADAHSEEPCPDCGTPAPRLISHTSFVLKGGGWYVTDYGYRKNVHEEASKDDHTSGASTEQKTSNESKGAAPKEASAKSSETKAPTQAPSTPQPKANQSHTHAQAS